MEQAQGPHRRVSNRGRIWVLASDFSECFLDDLLSHGPPTLARLRRRCERTLAKPENDEMRGTYC
jgi:hypothetical protein